MTKRPAVPAIFPVLLSAGALAGQSEPKVDFGRDIWPLLQEHCVECHGPDQQMSAFRLDRRTAALRGGRDPNDIVPGSGATSHLYLRLSGTTHYARMPPSEPLSDREIATFRAWIDQGATWPDEFANEPVLTRVDPRAARLMTAIRDGDAARFEIMLAREPDIAKQRGPAGATPLMYATLYGDLRSMRQLLAAGADPNVKNHAGATALMWAVGDAEKVGLLLDHGADVNARSDDGRTPLSIAVGQRTPSEVVRLLLDRGASPNPSGRAPGDLTALALAARIGNAEVMQLLLDHGAKDSSQSPLIYAVLARCDRCIDLALPVAPRPASSAALGFMARKEDAAAVRLLLERGADVNGRDSQGRTPLMNAAASDFVRPDIARLLLEHGADVNAAARDGRTALSFARQRGDTPLVEVLLRAGAVSASEGSTPYARTAAHHPVSAKSIRQAVQRSLPLLQNTDRVFLQKTGCVSCHHNSLTAMAVAASRRNGFRVNETVARQQLQKIVERQAEWRDRALQGIVLADAPFVVGYTLIGLAAERHPPDTTTDAMAIFLLNSQMQDGRWRQLAHRPPIEYSEVTSTATSLRGIQLYAPRSHAAAADQAIRTARDWLAKAAVRTSEERNMRALGLAWAGGAKEDLAEAVRAIVGEQRADGGWAQLPWLQTDAYATGQALEALRIAGMPVRHPVYQRGIRFLLKNQMKDGSWWLKTRSIPTQVSFDSGFPHGPDQWISAAATNWATIALAEAAKYDRTPVRVRKSRAVNRGQFERPRQSGTSPM